MMKNYCLINLLIFLFGTGCQVTSSTPNLQEDQAKVEFYKLYSFLSCDCEGVIEQSKNGADKNMKFRFLEANVCIDSIVSKNDTILYHMHAYPDKDKDVRLIPHKNCNEYFDYYAIAFKKDSINPIFFLANEGSIGYYKRNINSISLKTSFKNCTSSTNLNSWLREYLARSSLVK